ncbi:vitamin K epoxide reductase family protein [Patescibacteria group bacterium]
MTDAKLVRPKVNKILYTCVAFVFANLGLAIWLTYEYYAQNENSVCSINAVFDCLTVAQSEYAVLLGLPVAVWGIMFYSALLVGVLGVIWRVPFHKVLKFLRPNFILKLVRMAAYFGLLFSLYLTYIEAFELHVYCPFCLAQQAIIIVVVALLIWANSIVSSGLKETKVCEFC